MLNFSRLFVFVCIVSVYVGVFGIDPAQWKILHEKMLKKAAAEKATKAPTFARANSVSEDTSSIQSSVGSKSRNPIPPVAHTSPAELIDTIPIRLEYEDEVIDVEFKLFPSPDPSTQARLFCNQYDLSEAYCEALTTRAVDIFSSTMPNKGEPTISQTVSEPASSASATGSGSASSSSSTASKLRDILNKRHNSKTQESTTAATTTTTSASAAVSEPASSSSSVASKLRDILNKRRNIKTEESTTAATNTKRDTSPPAAAEPASVASKLADILSKRRKPAAPIVPPLPVAPVRASEVVGNIIDIIPIRMEYEDEIVDIEFKVYDNLDPTRQAKSFCLEHDLADEYCEALTARAESLFSNKW